MLPIGELGERIAGLTEHITRVEIDIDWLKNAVKRLDSRL